MARQLVADVGGCMQVVIPVTVPGHGPLGITLLGLAKSDAALVTVAGKLGPLIADQLVAMSHKANAGVPGLCPASAAQLAVQNIYQVCAGA